LHWNQLPGRAPYIPHGGADAFDSGSTSSAGSIVTMGDTSFFYYTGSRFGQSQSNRNNVSGLGRAEFKRERFAAQMGRYTGGFLLTRELIVGASELYVNTTVADGYRGDVDHATVPPEFACEIVQTPEDGGAPRPVPGYTLADCTTLAVDLVENRVTWKGHADLAGLVGQRVLIRFYLKNCGVYSLRFREPLAAE
jgi:hypothetical protein